MGLFDDGKGETDSRVNDQEELAYEKEKVANKTVVIGSLVVSFLVGFVVAETEPMNLLNPFLQKLSSALGAVFGTVLFAGISSAIAAKFTTKWRYLWIAITSVLIISQIVVYFYEQKYLD
ncbi:MAG: hypothetical protein KF855_17750 [Acidobacteria bacterium]|nr:hypothetical protein [Acidobacteriota bacterium]